MLKTKCAVCGNDLIEDSTNSYEELYGEISDWLVVDMHCPVCDAEVRYVVKTTESGFTMNCDNCCHRSETCLCDISKNEEVCPLLAGKEGIQHGKID